MSDAECLAIIRLKNQVSEKRFREVNEIMTEERELFQTLAYDSYVFHHEVLHCDVDVILMELETSSG